MYTQQALAGERHQELLKMAERERAGQLIVQLRKLERQRERAERQLLRVWQRVERTQSVMSAG